MKKKNTSTLEFCENCSYKKDDLERVKFLDGFCYSCGEMSDPFFLQRWEEKINSIIDSSYTNIFASCFFLFWLLIIFLFINEDGWYINLSKYQTFDIVLFSLGFFILIALILFNLNRIRIYSAYYIKNKQNITDADIFIG